MEIARLAELRVEKTSQSNFAMDVLPVLLFRLSTESVSGYVD